jgi:hypothetical protein
VDSIVGSSFNLVANAPIIQTYLALSGTRSTSLTITLPNITQLYGLINNTNQTGYDLVFQISGSSFGTYTLPAGQTATIITDNGVFFVISQTLASTTFSATSGTAAAPSYFFNLSTNTGMYLPDIGKVGLSGNGQLGLTVDGSAYSGTPLSLKVIATGVLSAGLISGGTF